MKTHHLITCLALGSLTMAARSMAAQAPPVHLTAALRKPITLDTFSFNVIEMWEAYSLRHGNLDRGEGVTALSVGVATSLVLLEASLAEDRPSVRLVSS